MKIKQLDIAGFRSLKNVSWQPGDLNVVIGQNGTGKSNLLRMLELIAASAQGRLSKYIQTAGGLEAVLWDGTATSITFQLKIVDSSPLVSENDYKVAVSKSFIPFGQYLVQEVLTHNSLARKTKEPTSRTVIDRNIGRASYSGSPIDPNSVPSQETFLSLVTSLALTPINVSEYQLRKQLSSICIYHDLNVGQDSKIRQATVARFEKQIAVDGQNLVPVLHTLYTGDREFKRNLDSAMRAAFGGDYEELVFPPAADQRVQLRVRWKTLQREQSAADLSDGTLRFLLLLTILTAPDPPLLIAIDEPETGLHPSMLPILAAFAEEAAERTQIIFTTHSPQFLSAFGKTKPTTTVASWEDGETKLAVLDEEELAYWLKEYSFGELFESGQLEAMA